MRTHSLNLITYNVLHPYYAMRFNKRQGYIETASKIRECNWHQRKEHIASNLFHSKFSIACLQEVSDRSLHDLRGRFKEWGVDSRFTIAGFSKHWASCPEAENGVAIVYDAQKVNLLAISLFQSLSEDLGWRGEILADFEEPSIALKLRISSVHLKGYSKWDKNFIRKNNDKIRGFNQLIEVMKALEAKSRGINSLMIAGDFNEDMSEKDDLHSRLAYLFKQGYQSDERIDGVSIHGKIPRQIDYIFHKTPAFKYGKLALKPLDIQSLFPSASDHYLVGSIFEFCPYTKFKSSKL